jgi:drug/metabolite transporter (DMT)-like permease
MPEAREVASRLQVAAAATLFSTGGAVIKATDLTGWQVASFRSGTAVLAVLLLMSGARRRPGRTSFLVGACYAATLILFVLATKLTTAANAIFLQATAPIHVVLLSPWLLREPVRRRDLGFLLILGAGLVLFLAGGDAPQATAPAPATGNLLAVASGLTFALTVCGLRSMSRREAEGSPGAASAVVVGNLIACLAALPAALPVTTGGAADALAIAYLGVVQIGVAYACLTAALRRVAALPAALLLFLEPVLNPVWVYLVHGERVGGRAIVGGALILGGAVVKNVLDLRSARD